MSLGTAAFLGRYDAARALDAVRVMVEGGADLRVRDRAHGGTPLGWADYYIHTGPDAEKRGRFEEIAAYLISHGAEL